VPQKRPTASDVEASPSLRRDLLSFGSAFGEPVTASHVAPMWPLGWTVGSIGGDALRATEIRGMRPGSLRQRPRIEEGGRQHSSWSSGRIVRLGPHDQCDCVFWRTPRAMT